MIYDEQGNAWFAIAKNPPPTETPLMTAIFDKKGWRNQQSLTRSRGLWFAPDMSTYIYYAPTHWRPIPGVTDKNKMADYTLPKNGGGRGG